MAHPSQIEAALSYLQRGDCKRALKAAKLAAKQAPNSPLPPNVSGIALSTLGRPQEAIPFFQKALKLKPDFSDAQQNLAQALIATGRAPIAIAVLNTPSAQKADSWKRRYILAQAHVALGQERQAVAQIDAALTLEPRRTTLLHFRSRVMLSLGRIPDAIANLNKALEIDPNDVRVLTALSLPLARQAQSQAALETVEKAVAVDPRNAPARFRLATQLVEMGRMEDARREYQTLLGTTPDHSAALERLVEILPSSDAASMEKQVRHALTKAPRNSEDRASAFYALSKVSAASGKTDEAQKALASANREMARIYPYDAAADAKVTAAILDRFPKSLKLPAARQDTPRPVFVLGLPRSGTTLAEAILGMHPDVVPLGERGTLGFLLRDTIEQDQPFSAQDATQLEKQDNELLPPLPPHTAAYTDKMPENYRLVGFLEMIHPNARIIHIRRDPRDNALSMWKSHFSGSVLSYTYDLKWMAAKFNLYAEMMTHWQTIFPDRILDIQYEDMVQDVEATGRKMASFCGLDWHDQMAQPNKSTAQILTLSATQLRRPVHTNSIGKWRAEAEVLEPFVNALTPQTRRDLITAA